MRYNGAMRAHSGTAVFRVLGHKMLAKYHRPAGPEGKRFATVLFLHGFPGSEKSVDVQRELLRRGIASVAPSFLGAWGSGGKYRFTTLVPQARAALRAARKLPFVNPRRVAVYGFSMGGFASCRLLPRPMFWAAAFYLIAGCCCLVYARGNAAFSPWAMGLTFGIGQAISAAILYWTLERRPEAVEEE